MVKTIKLEFELVAMEQNKSPRRIQSLGWGPRLSGDWGVGPRGLGGGHRDPRHCFLWVDVHGDLDWGLSHPGLGGNPDHELNRTPRGSPASLVPSPDLDHIGKGAFHAAKVPNATDQDQQNKQG